MPKIIVETDKCIGCGACQAACEKFFVLEGDIITLKEARKVENNQELEVEDLKCASDAVDICPVQCIRTEK